MMSPELENVQQELTFDARVSYVVYVTASAAAPHSF